MKESNESDFMNEKLLHGIVGYNKYGGYFAPRNSMKRPAVRRIVEGEVYEPGTIKFMRDNCGAGDIVHAGTFFGDFLPGLAGALSDNAKLWAFEPQKENFRCAQITVLINDLKNVELFNYGLGDKPMTSKMLIETSSGDHLGGGSKVLKNEDKSGKTMDIQIECIDRIVPYDREVSIIQLDVEGYEKEALIGCKLTLARCRPILILEDNSGIVKTEWFTENIASLGYEKIRRIHGNTLFAIRDFHQLR